MNRFWMAPCALALLSSTGACSGADGNDLLGDSGTITPDASAPTQDASTSQDATTPQDASSPQDASTDDVVTIADASQPDVKVGPPDSLIQCGPQVTCSAQNQTCCWHMTNNAKPYECVTNIGSCSGEYDVPITCSTPDNCASQGNAGYQCCATGGNFGTTTQCSGYDVATVVACKSSCGLDDYEIGCSVQQQNCADNLQTCVVSKCTDPGATLCE